MLNSTFLKSRLIPRTISLCLNVISPQKSIRHYTIRRAVLHVPGNNVRKIEKALTLRVDCLAFNMEGVDIDKEQARTVVNKLLNERNITKTDPEWCIKINPIDAGHEFLEDINAIFSAKSLPPAIALPGVHTCDHLQFFAEHIWEKLTARPDEDRGPVQLLLIVGSASGMMRLDEICRKAEDLATMAPITPSALVFDADNLLYTLGATKTTHGIELLYARQKLILTAKAFGLQAIDMANINPNAMGELKKECMEGAVMGFTGKQVIYPAHIPLVQDEFNVTRSKIRHARFIMREFKKREEEMNLEKFERIPKDLASLKVAEHTINVAKFTGKLDEEEV